jgi:flagellar FliL protein
MAKEAAPTDLKAQQAATTTAPTPNKSPLMKKILMIGGPILVVQIVLIYFIVGKFLAPKSADASQGAAASAHEEKKGEDELASQVVVVKDVIVNPAGTNGTRFLVTTIGLEVPTTEAKTELEQKEVQTRDILTTILAGKRLEELTSPQQKEELREEIHQRVDKILKSAKLKNVYISKFIIQ